MSKLIQILLCFLILIFIQSCTQAKSTELIETPTNIVGSVENNTATQAPTSITLPTKTLSIDSHNAFIYLESKITYFLEDENTAIIDNSHGENDVDTYQFLYEDPKYLSKQPLQMTINLKSRDNKMAFIILAGRLNTKDGDWWRGVHEFYIIPYDDHIDFAFHDGRGEFSQTNVSVNGIEAGENFTIIFDSPEGIAFDILNAEGDFIKRIDTSTLEVVDFPNGLFPDKKVFIGAVTEKGAVLEVNEFSIKSETVENDPLNNIESLEWQHLGGPRGGTGYDIRVSPSNPQTLWVTDVMSGVHASVDGGETWVPMNEGINARRGLSGDAIPIFCLTIDPLNPQTMWAGTQGSLAIYKTVDGGQTWVSKVNGIVEHPVMEFRGFAVHPENSDIVFAAGNYLADEATQAQRGFIYRTMNGGETWSLVMEPTALVRWIIIDPIEPSIIYASTGIFDRKEIDAQGVLKSVDGGENWFEINEGLENLAINALSMHPENPLILLAGTGKALDFSSSPEDEFSGGVYLTKDGGNSWVRIDPVLADNDEGLIYSAVAFSPSNPNIIYADAGHLFLRSPDGGQSWDIFKTGANPETGFYEHRGIPIALVVDPENPDRILMNAYAGGVFISEDGGRTWRDSSKGMSGAQVWSLDIDVNRPAYVVAGSKNGVHLSLDGGESWTGLITKDHIRNISSIAIDESTDGRILMGNDGQAIIYLSTDGGLNWLEVLGPLRQGRGIDSWRTINDLEFTSSDPNIVYAATGIGTFGMNPTRGTVGNGMFVSVDGGKTWEPANNGLTETTLNIFSVVADPNNPQLAYIGTMDDGIFMTQSGGSEWVSLTEDQPFFDVRTLAIDPENPRTLLAGAFEQGLWKSTNQGESWVLVSNGIPLEAQVSDIQFNPTNPDEVFLSDLVSGVYYSSDNGENWKRFNDGMRTRAVRDLAISADGRHLYAGTDGNGVYRYDFGLEAPPLLDRDHFPRFENLETWPVTIDGESLDWQDKPVVGSDPINDTKNGFLNFGDGYAFRTSEAIFFLVDVIDPIGSVTQFRIHLKSEEEDYTMIVGPWGTVGAILSVDNRYLGETNQSYFGFYPEFEGRIDFRDLNSSESVQLISIDAIVGTCCFEGGGTVIDSWRPDSVIPLIE